MENNRESGIELLKILAIAMIVIAHVVQTLGKVEPQLSYYPTAALINLSKSTMNFEIFILQNMMYLGSLGNSIFFICSAWFLCDSKKVSFKKIALICLDVWIVSVLYLIIIKGIGISIPMMMTIKSIFPTIFANNWYITFYILIYAIHPLLNSVINQLNKNELLRICLVFAFLYFGICFVKNNLFFASQLVTYSVLYFCIAYIKRYTPKYTTNMRLNIKLLFLAIVANVGLIFFTNILGIIGTPYIKTLGEQVLRWASNYNPFLILTAISLFNIFKELHFVNKNINYISSLSLLIYVIHENILFRTYVRPCVYVYIYEVLGYNFLLLWVFLFAIILFLASLALAGLYKQTIQKVTSKFADKITPKLLSLFDKLEKKIIKIE